MTHSLNSLAITVLFVLAGLSLSAQKNVVKLRPIRTAFTAAVPVAPVQLNLTYERVIVPKLSTTVTVNYGLERSLQSLIDLLEIDEVRNTTASSFGFAPELRFYPGIKKTPRGIYIAGQFFYNRYWLDTEYKVEYTSSYTLPDNNPYSFTYVDYHDLEGRFTTIGGSIGIGSQWLFGDHFSVDILWVGIGVGNRTTHIETKGRFVSEDALVAALAADQDQFTEEEIRASFESSELPTWNDLDEAFGESISNTLSDYGINTEREVTRDGITVTSSGLAIQPRLLHISIGFAF